MTDSGSDSSAGSDDVRTETTAVRRSPRYLRFIVVGAIVGVVVALIATLAFPENPEFGRLQTFGFLVLFGVALFGVIGAVVALIFDARARVIPVVAEHEVHAEPEPDSDAPSTDWR